MSCVVGDKAVLVSHKTLYEVVRVLEWPRVRRCNDRGQDVGLIETEKQQTLRHGEHE